MTEILNAHGSKNDIFVAAMPPRDFASEADLQAFVRRLCDRDGAFGGDGVYFYDAGPRVPEAWFFNPDGSFAEFCGNGMRCLGRVILELRGADEAVIRSGPREYTVRRGSTTAEGVRQISLEHPAVDFTPDTPVVAGRRRLYQARLPELDPTLEFTAVSIPNPHLVALIDTYVESDLIAMGERVAVRQDVFPAGANLSVLLPLAPTEIFVRTYERGAGLTASCGSGMAASRPCCRAPPDRHECSVLIRTAGRMATAAAGPPRPGTRSLGQRDVRRPATVDPPCSPAARRPGETRTLPPDPRALRPRRPDADRLRAAAIQTPPSEPPPSKPPLSKPRTPRPPSRPDCGKHSSCSKPGLCRTVHLPRRSPELSPTASPARSPSGLRSTWARPTLRC